MVRSALPAPNASAILLVAAALSSACSYVEPTDAVDHTCTAPGEVHVLAEDEPGVTAIVVDGDHAYWSSRRGPRRVPVDGGVVVDLMLDHPDYGNPLRSGAPVGGLAIDGSYVWFGIWGALWRIPRSGGVAELVAGGNDNMGSTGELVADDEYVWWVDATFESLYRWEKRAPATGFYVVPFADTAGSTHALEVDDEHVWFGTSVIARDGFRPQVLDAGLAPRGIAAIDGVAYWSTESGAIVRIDPDATVQVFSVGAPLGDIVAFEGRLYFALDDAEGGWGEMEPDGSGLVLHRVGETVAPDHLAVTADAVYLVAGSISSDVVKVCR